MVVRDPWCTAQKTRPLVRQRSEESGHTLDKLKEVVSNFVISLDKAEVRKALRDLRPRTELCIKTGVFHFESKVKTSCPTSVSSSKELNLSFKLNSTLPDLSLTTSPL